MDEPQGIPEAPGARILVLNRLWQAVNIVGVRRAFSLLFQEHARIIHCDSDAFEVMDLGQWLAFSAQNPPRNPRDCIHTVRLSVRIPRVMLLGSYDRLPVKEIKFTRDNIFRRDDHVCQYCGQKFRPLELNLDHVIPRDRGGRTSWENIVTSCIRCNSHKANRLPHEAGMRLIQKPKRPSWRPFVAHIQDEDMDDSWMHFIHLANVSTESAS